MKADNVALSDTLFSESLLATNRTTQQPNVSKLLLWAITLFISWFVGIPALGTTESAFCQVVGGINFAFKIDMNTKYVIMGEANLEFRGSERVQYAVSSNQTKPRRVIMKADNVALSDTLFSESLLVRKISYHV